MLSRLIVGACDLVQAAHEKKRRGKRKGKKSHPTLSFLVHYDVALAAAGSRSGRRRKEGEEEEGEKEES